MKILINVLIVFFFFYEAGTLILYMLDELGMISMILNTLVFIGMQSVLYDYKRKKKKEQLEQSHEQ